MKANRKTIAKPIKLDFAPLADLAIILLLSFVALEAWRKPNVMPVILPSNSPHCGGAYCQLYETRLLTIYLLEDKVIVSNDLLDVENPRIVDYSVKNVRQLFADYKRELPADNDPIVVVKPTATCNYGDLVAVLNELKIAHITRYTMVYNLMETEKEAISNYKLL